MPKIENLNLSLKANGFPEVKKQQLVMGGQGFFDISLDEFEAYLRFTGFGNGFTNHETRKENDTVTKSVKFNMGMGGLSAEIVKPLTSAIDVTFGLQFSIGSLNLDLYQYDNSHGSWMRFDEDGTSSNITRNYKVPFYSAQPQLGAGLLIAKFIYLKLTAGYMFSAQGTWTVDDDIDVRNMPSGIKADGLNFNFEANFGLFFRD
jgi:hypothetical protein